MRIGIDASFIGTKKPTGLAVYTWNIVNELARLHNDIVLWTCEDYGFTIPQEHMRLVMQKWSFLGERRFMIRPFWMESILPQLIRREKIDILFSTVPGGMARCPVPHVVTVHDIIPVTYPVDHPPSVRWSFRKRLPLILRKSASIIADSEHTKRDIVDHFGLNPRNIHVIPLGYDTENFRPIDSPKTLAHYGLRKGEYIATVGNATFRKNHETLIVALGKIHERVPHRLVLAGPVSPEQERRLKSVARAHGVEDRLVFPGYVPYSDLPALYSGAALFAYISLYEGFGLPVLEAMACGTPVVASNTTSIPEVAGQAAILVDPVNCEEIAAAMDLILNDTNRRDSLRAAGLERVTCFSWEQAAKETLSVLQCAVKGKFQYE
jgi:glycosyltransferase involved in cell wall biosynthesis